MKRKATAPTALDLSYLHSVPVKFKHVTTVNLWMVGGGGTGSWLAPDLARLAYEFREQWAVKVRFIDHDIVEDVNIPRQNFCQAEIGRNKAETLAARYGHAWGLDIAAVPSKISAHMVDREWDNLYIILGCVDNAEARQTLSKLLERNYSEPDVWWLDSGNAVQSGQVLLGCAYEADRLKHAFKVPTLCTSLPSPALQHPELLVPRPEELPDAKRMSCAEIAAANFQALTVNKQTAAHAAAMLRLFLTGELRYYALYFDQASGTAHAKYITRENVVAFAPQEKRRDSLK